MSYAHFFFTIFTINLLLLLPMGVTSAPQSFDSIQGTDGAPMEMEDEPLNAHWVSKKDGVLDEHSNSVSKSNEILALFTALLDNENNTETVIEESKEIYLTNLPENITSLILEAINEIHKTQTYTDELAILQFLEPDLGPAVLPLKVPSGYFVPFIPRKAFGVANGVSRPPHGHSSFYKYRPRGLVDVRNTPAYGFLFGGP